jgi:hypothetical protein
MVVTEAIAYSGSGASTFVTKSTPVLKALSIGNSNLALAGGTSLGKMIADRHLLVALFQRRSFSLPVCVCLKGQFFQWLMATSFFSGLAESIFHRIINRINRLYKNGFFIVKKRRR